MIPMPLRMWTRWLQGRKSRRSNRLAAKRRLNLQYLEDRAVPATLFGLTDSNQLLRFDTSNPGAAIQVNVSGLGVGESLTSIDFRPANETLYAISNVNSNLYTINTTTGAATLIGAGNFTPVATRFGIDFNPVVDRIRFVSNTGNNIRINPNTGTVASFDPAINGATTGLVEVAYTNNFAGATSTQLFGINADTDELFEVTSPNNGTTVLVGSLGVDTDDQVGFDISFDDGVAYASFTIAGVATLFSIDTATGAATSLGTIGSGSLLIGLSAAPLLNAPPVVTLTGSVQTYDVDSDVPVVIDPSAIIFDPDSTNFDGGTMKVSLSAGQVGDLIDIRNQGMGAGQVGTSGGNVFFGGVQVGSYTTGDGTIVPLTITFNTNATPAAAEAVLRNVTFSTTDNTLSLTNRQAQVVVEDGDGGTGTSGFHEVKLADLTPPTVTSIVRVDPNPTNDTLLNYTVTFNEDVTGVDVTDFLVTSTGSIAGTSVISVTPVDAKTYTVQVENLTGEGNVRLDVTDDDSILDLRNNMLGGTGVGNGDFKSGEVYTIDRTNPIVIIAEDQGQPDPSFTQPVNFFVSFSEVMTGFDATDVIVSGTAGATIVTISDLGGGNYKVAVSGATMDGTIIIDVADGAATDAAGNPSDPQIIFDNQVTVNLVNDAPVFTVPAGNVAATEDKSFTFDKTNAISVTDSDLNGGKLIVTITAADGTISLSGITGLTFTTGDGTADKTMTFSGLETDVNAALANLVFAPTANFFGTTTITVDADDQGSTGTGGAQVGHTTVTLDVAGVNDGPTITIATQQSDIVTAEDTKVAFTTGLITLADIDAGVDAVQVTLSVTSGTLTFADFSKLTFTTGDGTADAKMVFTGSIADINAALNGLSYLGNLDFNGTDIFSVNIDDLGRNGTGGNLTDSDTIEISVTAVNDGPVNSVPGTQVVDEDGSLTFTGANAISIADVDAGPAIMKVSLTATNGLLTLSGTTGLTFTAGDGTGDASMTFTGTIANINAALAGSKFAPTANFNGAASIQIVTDDQGAAGTGSSLTDTDTVTINVNGTNDAPFVVNDTFTTKQNQTLHVDAPGVLLNDTDPEGTPLTFILVTDVPAATGKLIVLGNGSFDFVPAANFVGTTTFQYKASDGTAESVVATVTITITENFTHLFATGAGAGGSPHVVVHNADGSVRFSFNAFADTFTGGVAVATGDVNGDGIEDIVVGAGPGAGSHVRVLSGANLAQIHSFMAFDMAFTGGVSVAAGDVNGDGFSDIIVGAGAGAGSHVQVFDGTTGSVIQSFMAYDSGFTGGVSVASGDYDGDGKADIVTGAGPGGGPHVIVYAGMSGQILSSFYAFDEAFAGGVNVAAGQFNVSTTANVPDIQPAIFTAAGAGGVPVVSVYNFATQQPVASFFAFEETDKGGVNIGSENMSNGSTLLYLGAGRDRVPTVRVVDVNTLGDQQTFNAYDPSFLGGVFIG